MSVWECMQVITGVQGGQRHQIPLELDLQVVMTCPLWVLGPTLGSSERMINTLNHGAISLQLPNPLFLYK